MTQRFAALALVLAACHPLPARVAPVVDTYYGVAVVDPYRWMEQPNNAELAAWMKAQGARARAALATLPDRDALRRRIAELSRSVPRIVQLARGGDTLFYLRREPGAEVPKLLARPLAGGEPRVILDPAAQATAAAHFAIDWYYPSSDGAWVACGVSANGSEDSVLSIVDATTGARRPETIDRTQLGGVTWLDGGRFTYRRLQRLGPGTSPSDRYRNVTTYLHVVGTDPATDVALLGPTLDAIPMKDIEFAELLAPPGSPYVVATITDGNRPSIGVWVAARDHLTGPWTRVAEPADGVRAVAAHGDDLFLLSYHDAPTFAVLATRLSAPDLAHARVVLPARARVLESIQVARDGLWVTSLDAGRERLERLPYAGGRDEIVLPVAGAIGELATSPDRDGPILGMESWVIAPRVYAWDAGGQRFIDTGFQPPPPVDVSGVIAEEVEIPSADGTQVPLSIVRRRDLALDGSHPTLVEGYGGYGAIAAPWFRPTMLAFLERGGVWATCHVRGGGEKGEAWHTAGMMRRKVNGIADLVACARALQARRLTAPSRTVAMAHSAGGILIGGAIVRHPEVFGAAIIRVGVLNALRFEASENDNTSELGSVATREGFEGLLVQDAYHQIVDGTPYPAVLLTVGATDTRVSPWQVTKFAARLMAATSSGRPVYLRVDEQAGHGLGSTASQQFDELADMLAFELATTTR